jgi:hypothetical protein
MMCHAVKPKSTISTMLVKTVHKVIVISSMIGILLHQRLVPLLWLYVETCISGIDVVNYVLLLFTAEFMKQRG